MLQLPGCAAHLSGVVAIPRSSVDFFDEFWWRARSCSILITENASTLVGEIQGDARRGRAGAAAQFGALRIKWGVEAKDLKTLARASPRDVENRVNRRDIGWH
jgi:hypothetical protein